jgi:ASC-1-like (ASCH) protein
MSDKTETHLPWGNDTITIKGRNSGIPALTVHFDGETLNLVDFLNHSVKAEYAAIYETIMSKYEARLKSGDIFDHNFPEVKFACKEIDIAQYKSVPSLKDKELIEALLQEYHACLDDLKDHFNQYEAHVERWYSGLPEEKKT